MRFTLLHVPYLLLALLPIVTSYYGHGIVSTLVWIVLWLLLNQAIIFNNTLTRFTDKRVILNTLPISHYVEKVRWCLDKTGIDYEEEKDIGIFWSVTTGRLVPTLRIPANQISISNSSDILKYLYAHMKGIDEAKAKFLERTPKSVELEEKIDRLGSLVRTYVYYQILVASKNPNELALKVWGMKDSGIPTWQKTILMIFLPILKQALFYLLKINKEHADSDLKKAEEFFKEIDLILSENDYILGTSEPTYIDYAFASLAAILVLPDQYGGPGLSPDARLNRSELGVEAQNYSKQFTSTPSGRFVLKMYAEHR